LKASIGLDAIAKAKQLIDAEKNKNSTQCKITMLLNKLV